ncbi:gp017 [Erwinia phage vB_EamP-S6]|uniref:Gp017 n=1 Tax=Erwinia phage vB_EamP-S6 TaxID=1051675 RepID=G0YQA9_9CAUD|nr:gp017 [Erwinia phage vB_EamP-S6]AEJ81536.1 gp017 [Erwinia phage vB_EamP-S6]
MSYSGVTVSSIVRLFLPIARDPKYHRIPAGRKRGWICRIGRAKIGMTLMKFNRMNHQDREEYNAWFIHNDYRRYEATHTDDALRVLPSG